MPRYKNKVLPRFVKREGSMSLDEFIGGYPETVDIVVEDIMEQWHHHRMDGLYDDFHLMMNDASKALGYSLKTVMEKLDRLIKIGKPPVRMEALSLKAYFLPLPPSICYSTEEYIQKIIEVNKLYEENK